ncbi:MAG: hypothetical protein NT001_03010, partial [Candidatus Woesearchaeota archaeon]|nr:hypothetical protein [Candidatus Woesearchaeota archaeon]
MKSNRLYLIAALAVIVLLIASGCNSITGQTVLGTEKEREQSPDNSTGTKIACSSDLDCGKPMIG